ncbi:MAG: threonine ammonia-lyase, biosynthetic, partial [Gammaproteobacteria bacterium]|nr:threonine ammonia-lyase, biosynthetic [Gammaproteobacteria bacterium]
MTEQYIDKILKARVYDVAQETALEKAPSLSRRLGCQVYLKREDQQPVFSFKLRGAYNKIALLSESELNAGVIAASAGNHAQGVALAAKKLGIEATIVMPRTTPEIKVQSVRHFGANIILHGDAYDEAYEHAMSLVTEKGMVFVHPFDDPDVIAGQGTVAMEILHQCSDDIDAIFIPVGGGGLIAGMSAYIKHLKPGIKVIGVEPDDAPCMHQALKQGERVILEQVGIFADGVAVRQVGKETFRIAQTCVDEVILVSTDEICAAIKDIFDDTRSIMEPAGALGVAGMKKYQEQHKLHNKTLIAINSGANMNFDRLRHVAERAEIGEQREALLAVTIPEEPGSFRKFCQAIASRGITEFNYRYADHQQAHIFAGIQLRNGEEEKKELLNQLYEMGYPVLDMTNNEMAKIHIRYMVGGHTKEVSDEQVYRFQFPERPGALLKFLTHMGHDWNISMFHYRNHGADYGRILIGIQVP